MGGKCLLQFSVLQQWTRWFGTFKSVHRSCLIPRKINFALSVAGLKL
jgi:hypothetical protein